MIEARQQLLRIEAAVFPNLKKKADRQKIERHYQSLLKLKVKSTGQAMSLEALAASLRKATSGATYG